MLERKFPILGTSVPPMLGRRALMQRMLSALTKPTPDHLQVVGPRFAGKTVIFNELMRRLDECAGPYTARMLWDLGHQTPASDEEFMQQLAKKLSISLLEKHPDYAKHLGSLEANPYQDIAEVLELLKADGGKVLAIFDGFDKALSNGRLTRNLWDQLRELAHKPSLRLITGSRKTLRDLIRHPDAQTSDFWNIFEPSPVRVGCFQEDEVAEILSHSSHPKLSRGTVSELWNATNGFPVLLLGVLNFLPERDGDSEVPVNAAIDACTSAFPELSSLIGTLWAECPPTSQDLMRRVLEEGTITRSGIANSDVEPLSERGFLSQTSDKLQRPSRLLRRYVDDLPNESGALVRLFGDDQAYRRNFKSVMERRLGQLIDADPDLRRYLQRSVEDLPAHPNDLLANIRGIVNRTFDLIWAAELAGRKIPDGWISTWKYNQERNVEDWHAAFPQGGKRLRLLDLMTGTEKSDACAKYVTKSTYVLMVAAHEFGNFGQHLDEQCIDLGTAYAALHLCIELAAATARELPH